MCLRQSLHGIIESCNIGLEGALKVIWSQLSCQKQGLGRMAQHPVQQNPLCAISMAVSTQVQDAALSLWTLSTEAVPETVLISVTKSQNF